MSGVADAVAAQGLHLGRNIDALQRQLGIEDDDLLAALGLSYNRFWDMKRRDWAQKKTVEQVAAALSQLAGVTVDPAHVLAGRLEPEQYALRAIEAFVRSAAALDGSEVQPVSGIRLPRLQLNGQPGEPYEVGVSQVVCAAPGDFVVAAADDCMLPTLRHGDELICTHAETAQDGELVVADWRDQSGVWRTVVRRLRRDAGAVWLSCDNQSTDAFGRRLHPDLGPAELRVRGVVVGLWRGLQRLPAARELAVAG